MLVFHNDSDTSYANYAGNLSSMTSAATAVTLNFSSTVGTSAANDPVVLTVTAGEEENVMEALAGAFAEVRSAMTIVASDVSGKTKYLVPGITAVNSISIDNGAGTFKNIINGVMDGSSADLGATAHSLVFTNAHSGSTVVLAATTATSTMTLPTAPIDGFNLRFVAAADNSAHTNTVAGSFDGVLSDGGDNTSVTGTTAFVIVASKLKKGDIIDIVYSGISSKYYLRAILKTADGVTVS